MSKNQDQSIDCPNLTERIFASSCTRLAIVSLHPGAGARTVVEAVAADFHQRGVSTGVTRAPRVHLEAEEASGAVVPIRLPAGAIVATTESLIEGSSSLELLEATGCLTVLGELNLYRVTEEGSFPVCGPDGRESLEHIVKRLEQVSGGLALVDGAWERRNFAAPDVTQAVILTIGAGYADNPARAPAAVRHIAELTALGRCDGASGRAWREASALGMPVALGANGIQLGGMPGGPIEVAERLHSLDQMVESIVLPNGLQDGLLTRLTRLEKACRIVVRDSTRVLASPVYYRAWLKKGGKVQVVEPTRLLAVATNPRVASGKDSDPDEFRQLVAREVSDLPVHDVRLEAAPRPKSRWKILRMLAAS